MEEVVSSNLTRSTKTFHRFSVSMASPPPEVPNGGEPIDPCNPRYGDTHCTEKLVPSDEGAEGTASVALVVALIIVIANMSPLGKVLNAPLCEASVASFVPVMLVLSWPNSAVPKFGMG